jgi:hypothetical protein
MLQQDNHKGSPALSAPLCTPSIILEATSKTKAFHVTWRRIMAPFMRLMWNILGFLQYSLGYIIAVSPCWKGITSNTEHQKYEAQTGANHASTVIFFWKRVSIIKLTVWKQNPIVQHL